MSTPKKACKQTEDSVYIAKVMYVAKGKYIAYTNDGMYVPIASTVSMPHGVYVAQGEYGKYVKGKLIPMDQ